MLQAHLQMRNGEGPSMENVPFALVVALAVTASVTAAADDRLVPWLEHRSLSLPIQMTVVGSQIVPAGTAQGFFGSLTNLGFECAAQDNTRWRLRRIQVRCSRGAESLVYDGGFPVGYSSVVFERVHYKGKMLGGTALTAHVGIVVADPNGEPEDFTGNLPEVRTADR
jgi:hypothetical protein